MDTSNDKKCMKSCMVSFLAVYIFIMAYGFVVHGMLLRADYEALMNAGLTRTEEDMQNFVWVCWLLHAVIAAAAVCLFKTFRKGVSACDATATGACCPIKSGGLKFGCKLGLILGSYMALTYVWMPIPGALAVKWFISEFVLGLGIGAILGMVCKSKDNGSCDMKAAG